MPGDIEARFRSHRTYVQSLSWVGGLTTLTMADDALERLAERAGSTLADRPVDRIDLGQVETSLRNGWSTEVLLGLPATWAADQDEFMRLSNSWGVVQGYYATYHLTQALIVAKGRARPTTHPQTQRQYVDLWVDRPLHLPPWTLGAHEGGWRNLPEGVEIDTTIHHWRACSNSTCWHLAAQALATTRSPVVDQARKRLRDEGQRHRLEAWRRSERDRVATGATPRPEPRFPRPRLSEIEKARAAQAVRSYGLMDYLYRLRVAANYQDAGLFIEGPDDDLQSLQLHRELCFLAAGLALLSEIRIRDLVGPATFHRWADSFIATSVPPGLRVGLRARRHLL